MDRSPSTTFSAGYENLLASLHHSLDEPVDAYTPIFAGDFIKLLETDPYVAGRVNQAFKQRETVDASTGRKPVNFSYAGNLALRSVHAEVFDNPAYPESHLAEGSWTKDILQCVINGNFAYIIPVMDVMSTLPTRYTTLRVLGALLINRQNRPLNIADIGASEGHGLKLIGVNHEFAPRREIYEGSLGNFNELMQEPLAIGRLVGIEKANIHDPVITRWAKACSIPPYEMTPERIAEYEKLEQLHVPNLEMKFEDATRVNFLRDNPDLKGEFDIVFMSTVVYQWTAEKREVAIANARRILRDGGIIVIQDFENDNWYAPASLPYRTKFWDSHNQGRWFTAFKWANGRCTSGAMDDKKGKQALRNLRVK